MLDKRPWGITLNVALLVIIGIIMLLGALGTALLTASVTAWLTDLLPITAWITTLLFFVVALSLVILFLAYYLWNKNRYAWWAVTILLIVGLVGNVWAVFTAGAIPVLSIVVQAVLLLGMLHKNTISFINPGIDWRGWQLEG